MNIKIKKRYQRNNNSNNLNNIALKNTNSGKIKEKLIMLNNEKTNRKENKIKEFEIIIKNTKINTNDLISKKNNNYNNLKINNSIQKSKISINNVHPYLKPKFPLKDKNSFSIKNKKNIKINNNINNNINDDINNIYLNFFKVYYDENGKKIKIIKNKNNYKKNKSKELVLTQNNLNLNKDRLNKKNENNNNNNKLKKNFTTDLFDFSSVKKKIDNNKNNIIEVKHFYPDTPSQSTTSDNKSLAKSGTVLNKEEIINNKINSLNPLNEECLKIKNNNNIQKIYYDNLPTFLKKRKNQKKNDKKYKKKNIDKKIILNSTEKISVIKDSMKKLNTELSQGFLITKINNDRFTINNNRNQTDFNISQNNKIKKDFNGEEKINYFHNDISNLTLNMTFEQNNITNTIKGISRNPNFKNVYISTFKKKNMKKQLKKFNPLCLNNTLTNIYNKARHSVGLHGNYFLFNFFRDKDKEIILDENRSLSQQKWRKYNSNLISRNNSFYEDSISSPKVNNNIIKYNNKDNLNSNTYTNENEINILNKTKEILKINEDDNRNYKMHYKINSDFENNKRLTLLNNSNSYFEFFPKSFYKRIKNDFSTEKFDNNYYVKRNNALNIDYYNNAKKITENNQQNVDTDFCSFNKLRRPCSLYMKNRLIENEKICKNSLTLNDYYNSAIEKESGLNLNISNIYMNTRSKIFQYKKIDKNAISNYQDINRQNQYETNNNIIENNKFSDIEQNQKEGSKILINKRINQIFKFNRNKYEHSANCSLNSIPSCFLIKKHRYNINNID